jgi:predicted ester cyclase
MSIRNSTGEKLVSTIAEIVKRGFTDVNSNVFNLFAEDLQPLLADHMASMRETIPDLRYELKSSLVKGNTIAFQFVGSGTDTASGRMISWPGSGFAHVLNGKIRAVRVKADQVTQKIQLGNMPRVGFGPLTGGWRAKALGLNVNLSLNHDEDGLWGTVDIENVGTCALEGKADGDTVHWTATLPSGERVEFAGRVRGDDTFVGNVPGLQEVVSFARS